ncbi:uncharacterized protein PAC_11716 [Phialocephala subalpina]|uniref:BTB domain-containing protein n=1 Tax=Phialocephala subalpina TaxID=576137 RepID=A0A1L7X9X2_9HELO|nr:uncharacterized protein PAC_11716 [Phialocephala subalpina]
MSGTFVQDVRSNAPNLCHPQDIVTVLVAKDASKSKDKTALRSFPLYKSVLCRQSPFFKAAFKGPFIEGQSQSMTLEDVGIEEFGSFVHWMHYGVIASKHGVESGDVPLIPTKVLIKLWMLGERFLVPQLQNDAMDILYNRVKNRYSNFLDNFKDFHDIMGDSEAPAPLRQFVLDGLLSCPESQLTDKVLDAMEPEMMKDVVRALKAELPREKGMPSKMKYHVHTDVSEPNRRRIPEDIETSGSVGKSGRLSGNMPPAIPGISGSTFVAQPSSIVLVTAPLPSGQGPFPGIPSSRGICSILSNKLFNVPSSTSSTLSTSRNSRGGYRSGAPSPSPAEPPYLNLVGTTRTSSSFPPPGTLFGNNSSSPTNAPSLFGPELLFGDSSSSFSNTSSLFDTTNPGPTQSRGFSFNSATSSSSTTGFNGLGTSTTPSPVILSNGSSTSNRNPFGGISTVLAPSTSPNLFGATNPAPTFSGNTLGNSSSTSTNKTYTRSGPGRNLFANTRMPDNRANHSSDTSDVALRSLFRDGSMDM